MNKMNALLTFYLGICLLLSSTVSIAQSADEITHAIQAGSSRELAKHFSSTVTLSINNAQGDYSSNQTELIIRDFFKKFPPEDFKIIHHGDYSENNWYFIGNYTSEEADFKVLVQGKLETGTVRISSMDFSRE